MLTDKCKADFEKWYDSYIIKEEKNTHWIRLARYFELPQSMQYGVYVDFFDQAGYDLVVFKWRDKYASNVYEIDGRRIGEDSTIGKDKGYATRQLARLNVIKQANTIYNENISNTSIR